MKHLFLLLTALCLHTSSYSCSCSSQWEARGFCTIVANAQSRPMFCVVQAKVVSWHHWGMRVKVLDVVRANPNGDTITVWGDNGACCRPSVSGAFALGDTVVMCLEQTDFMGNFLSTEPDYELSSHYALQGCGAYFLRFSNGNVTGSFDNNEFPDTIEYNDFKSRVFHCLASTSVANPIEKTGITVYPNPADEIINITSPSAMSELQLTNSLGQCVLRKNVTGNHTYIDLSQFATGIYTLKVYSAGNSTIWHHRIMRQ